MFGKNSKILHSSSDSVREGKTPHDATIRTEGHNGAQSKAARQIAETILELRDKARKLGLFSVMVPLEFAFYEASSVGNHVKAPTAEIEHLNRLAEQARKAATEHVASCFGRSSSKAPA